MAGRGRGRGRGMSFNIEQLGFTKGEALPGIVTAPPPIFPPLEHKPLPTITDNEQEYLLIVRKQLNARMKDSPYYINPIEYHESIQRYSDRLNPAANGNKELPLVWNRFPAELRPKVTKKATKRKITSTAKPKLVKRSQTKVEDVDKHLQELEEKEKAGSDEEEETKEEKEGEEEETEEKEKEDEEMEDEEVDEELDFGTDYMNSYFDNGEGFLDEDDNIDDEPVF